MEATIFKEQPSLPVFKGLEFFNLNLQITSNLMMALNVFLKMLQKCAVKCKHIFLTFSTDFDNNCCKSEKFQKLAALKAGRF